MKTRSSISQEALALSDAGTESIDIRPGSPLSAIELIFGGTKGATENQSDKIQDIVKTIQLVNGSEVLWSLSMIEAVALNCFEMGRKPAHEYDLSGSGTAQETVWLNFGRFLFDPDYWLNPTKYENLQLKIETNLTAAAGTYVTGTITVDVILHIIEEGSAGYKGYFSAKEVYSWTTVASGVETVDMPVDYPYRFILIGDLEDGVAAVDDITDIKLTANSDRYIVFDYDTADMLLRNRSEYGEFIEYIKSTLQDTDTLNSSLFDIIGVAALGGDEDFAIRCASVTGNTMTFSASAQT